MSKETFNFMHWKNQKFIIYLSEPFTVMHLSSKFMVEKYMEQVELPCAKFKILQFS